jgi:uncharacterized membrane protein
MREECDARKRSVCSAAMDLWRRRLRVVLVVFMVAIGIGHFVRPGPFASIVPAFLPVPLVLVLVSGFFEVLGGVGLLVPRARRAASYGLVLLYVSVFPANINMALHPELGQGIPSWALWGRLPFQVLFIAWVLWVGRTGPSEEAARTRGLAGQGVDR